MYKLREYQQKAVDAVNKDNKNGILVLPTGGGKSLIIANIVKKLQGKTLILQPDATILKQNYEKYISYGYNALIYSASLNQKQIDNNIDVIFATIGSVMQIEKQKDYKNGKMFILEKCKLKNEYFENVKNIIIDECHKVNHLTGVYKHLIDYIKPEYLIGLTATPYRMRNYRIKNTWQNVCEAKILTRVKDKIFKDILFNVSIKYLYENKFLCPLEYYVNTEYNYKNLEFNTSQTDFTEESMNAYNLLFNFQTAILNIALKCNHKYILVFCPSLLIAKQYMEFLKRNQVVAEMVSCEDKKKDFNNKVLRFKQGKIQVMLNVGTLTTGFDFPELDCIIIARPLMSLSLYQQMIGRGLRIYKNKNKCFVYDFCNTTSRFGRIETFELIKDKHVWKLKNSNTFLTDKNFITMQEISWNGDLLPLNSKNGKYVFSFGKYKNFSINNVPKDYIEFLISKFDDGYVKTQCIKELDARG